MKEEAVVVRPAETDDVISTKNTEEEATGIAEARRTEPDKDVMVQRLRQAHDEFSEWLYPDEGFDEPPIRFASEADGMLNLLIAYYGQNHESKATEQFIEITIQWDCAIDSLQHYEDEWDKSRITHTSVQNGLRTLEELGIIEDSGPYLEYCPYSPDDCYYVHHDVTLNVEALLSGSYRNA